MQEQHWVMFRHPAGSLGVSRKQALSLRAEELRLAGIERMKVLREQEGRAEAVVVAFLISESIWSQPVGASRVKVRT